MQQFSSYILGLLLSLSLKKQKNPPPKKLLYFRKWNFLALRLRDFLYFLKKSFSYIAGNRTFCERTFTTGKKKKSPPRKSFLHFGIQNFPVSSLKSFLYFGKCNSLIFSRKKKIFLLFRKMEPPRKTSYILRGNFPSSQNKKNSL